jgi:hypothetical protein
MCGQRRVIFVLSLLVLGALAGCGKQKTGFSGFLGDYSGLEPIAQGTYLYENPQLGIAEYDECMLEAIIVHFAPDAEGTAVNPKKLAELTVYFEEQARAALAEKFRMVDAPGPGVVRIRVGITDIKRGSTAMNVLPQTKLMGVGLGGASMEAEAVDSVSGQRVLAMVDSRSGERVSIEGLGDLDHAKQAVRYWVKDFVQRVEEARAAAPGR